MARQTTISHTDTFIPASFDSTNSTFYQQAPGYPETNGLKDGTGTYAGFHLTRGSGAVTDIWYNFDCSAIPDNATITSVSCRARVSMSTKTTTYVTTATLQLYSGTSTAKGSSTNCLTTTATYFDINGGNNWTVVEIKNCKILMYAKRGSRNTSSQYTARFFGAILTVDYTVNGMAYTITTTSSVDGDTVTPASVELREQSVAVIHVNATDITNKILTDNDNDVTSSLVYTPANTGGTLVKYPESVTTSGTISGLHYMTTLEHGVSDPSGETNLDYTSVGDSTAMLYYHFDFSDLPDSAVITNITVQVRYKVGGTSYAQTVNTYNGTSAIGTAETITSTTETTMTMSTPGTWTLAQLLDDPCVGIQMSFSGIIITGITWTIDYTANEAAYYRYVIRNLSTDHTIVWSLENIDQFFIKQNNIWQEVVKIYHKENGIWVEKNLSYLSDNDIDYLRQGS